MRKPIEVESGVGRFHFHFKRITLPAIEESGQTQGAWLKAIAVTLARDTYDFGQIGIGGGGGK